MRFNGSESSEKIVKNEERLANDETCSQNCSDDQCQYSSCPTHSFISSTTESRVIQKKEKPELKFGVKAILADDNEKRRNTENLPVLQILPSYNHSLQSSPTIQSGYVSGIAKPIARPTAYHPHHPPHPTHQPGPPAQHPFPPHAHHTLQLLACRGPYLTVSNPANGGHLSANSAVGAGIFSSTIQPGLGDLASLNAACFPWAASTRGRPRKGMMRRAVFSDTQRRGLERRFQLQKYISKPDRKKLAERLGLKDSQVKIWFQNRRMKWRNNKERELMASGGSREQTLPNKNNPNPDLSDTDNDRSSRLDLSSDVSTFNSLTDLTDNEENEEIHVT
ncbi:homeobox protein H2.0 isoform X1 [Fopius arisanus]|uniref:Homeobox protein H2.0 isoform X1 n=3 Tax=Fopius arisanus TaxID=64838 RepID=A0A9R1U811_9HYME|nr:PREDICTED: homeobox protein H2.0-like isoform X1 [Fopius arisanus]